MTISNPSNLSSILFRKKGTAAESEFTHVGPIAIVVDDSRVAHGRGLAATRDIRAGECLFVTPPVATANVDKVAERWNERAANSKEKLVEQIAEQVLVEDMMAAQDDNAAAALAFQTLVGGDNESTIATQSPSIDCLLGKATSESPPPNSLLSEHNVRQIVRRNAFGPDFVTFEATERQWRRGNDTVNQKPGRLLGIYPLAAMLNHSCVPNAVRVFSGETMVVHAALDIKAGQEIVWSYLPPTEPYPVRSETLQSKYGFTCQCERCGAEHTAWSKDEVLQQSYDEVSAWNQPLSRKDNTDTAATDNASQLCKAVQRLHDDVFSNKAFSNPLKRNLRVGYTRLYMHHLNATLANLPQDRLEADKTKNQLLLLCMELHFAFCACHNASTEHLSILHVCYELIGSLHTAATDKTKTLPKLQFWTEQLKRCHMIRYGSLGSDLERVRGVMQHSKMVLRQENGMQSAQYAFI